LTAPPGQAGSKSSTADEAFISASITARYGSQSTSSRGVKKTVTGTRRPTAWSARKAKSATTSPPFMS
jgi:hypothetical protein